MAEAALSVLCLDRRIANTVLLAREPTASTAARNRDHVCIHWRFTIDNARTKLEHLYPAQP